MNIPNIQAQMRRQAAMLLASDQANAVSVTLHWRTRTEPVDFDPNDESSGTVSTVPGTTEFRALFHQIDHRTAAYQRFMELETGTVILDYLEDLELDGKSDVRFEVNGRFYSQKPVGKDVLEMWSVENGDLGGFMRTIALMPVR